MTREQQITAAAAAVIDSLPATVGPRQLRVQRASEIEPKPVVWLWEERIPAGTLGLTAGREGIGKSLFLVWLTAQLTQGTLAGCFLGQPKTVIYVASEDSWEYTIAPRLIAAGADLDRVLRVRVETAQGVDEQLTIPLDTAELRDLVLQEDVALIAIDPLTSVIDSAIDAHKDRAIRTALEPLAHLADVTGAGVVGLVHLGKGSSTDVPTLILGSRAFAAVPRWVMGAVRDPDDPADGCVLSLVKANLGSLRVPSLAYQVCDSEVDTPTGPARVGRLEITGISERSVHDILVESRAATWAGVRGQAAAWLEDFLQAAGGSAPSTEVVRAAEAAGHAKSTLTRARTALGVTAERHGPQGSIWSLPQQLAHPPQGSRTEPDELNAPSLGRLADYELFALLDGDKEAS